MDQSNLLENMVEFNNKSRSRTKESKGKITYESVNALYEGQEVTLNAFKRGIFPEKETQSERLKILTPKQML